MVGLPSRGKTFISKRLTHYLNWIGIKTKDFHIGADGLATVTYDSYDFQHPNNTEAMIIRNRYDLDVLEDMCQWLKHGDGQVAVYDANNATRKQREVVHNTVCEKYGFKLFFVESIYDDPEMTERSMKEVEVHSPVYKDRHAKGQGLWNLMQEIENIEKTYQILDEITEERYSYMTIFNGGETALVNRCDGTFQNRVVNYLMKLRVSPRSIYFSRHGESLLNVEGRLGGNSELSSKGFEYARALAGFCLKAGIPDLHVWTSELIRTIQTASYIPAPQKKWKILNELDVGTFDKMTFKEIEVQFPTTFESREKDKYHFRYPYGESYEDLVSRLEPMILALENSKGNILVVSHLSVLRCLIGYFMEKPFGELPDLEVPFHSVIRLTPSAYGCEKVIFELPSIPVEKISDQTSDLSKSSSVNAPDKA